ncbi:methylmalonyl Co-A mutase-associated GTPase MeaB [Aquimarina sp. ERC-38]|uniref:methylmalonyl Co-A mutase-associated GTPase MeaB n=1 Tax=Aquimarina sp. ERC-38 TaxID=2949996 RepID=UPI0022478E50|nr:methylmalonyl Co-A mutase-associated GTPase MeaB [Aquimarina sp. ERC-38]UZO79292.1 methylmalonyl Co-A mutase-associated GTPase MeaB [Aquimarina sp. ERC-38]
MSGKEKSTESIPKVPSHINRKLATSFQKSRLSPDIVPFLFEEIRKGSIVALSQGITLVESKKEQDNILAQELIQKCLPYSGNSVRIGITGVPGVGKSTFIETLGTYWMTQHKKLAVLAVDPSSSMTKGSIMGDKTRMEKLAASDQVFIRPSAAGTSLGGVTQMTRETIILCEAAGYERIIVETVGVGQSETAVYHMTDIFLLLKLAGAGDELQGIKRGIIELADAILINKDDGDNQLATKKAKNHFSKALHLLSVKENDWQPKVLSCSALHNKGIAEANLMIAQYVQFTKQNKSFDRRRKQQDINWLHKTIENRLLSQFYQNKQLQSEIASLEKLVVNKKLSPFQAAETLLKKFT